MERDLLVARRKIGKKNGRRYLEVLLADALDGGF